MSEPNKYREWILQTIDSLRSRKARPDLERICWMIRRRHGSDPERTRAELEKLIHEQTVLKVSYKGSISYRNAAKVQRKNRKKTELAVVIVGSGGGDAQEVEEEEEEEGAREHEHLHNNKNSDSAQHSCSDLEEELDFEDDSEPNRGACFPAGGACRDPGEPPASNTGSGSGSSCRAGCCGATTNCHRLESGCKKKEASAPRDSEGLSEQQGAALSPGTGANEHRDARGGGEAMELSASVADSHDQTCSRSALSPPLLSPPQQQQLRVRQAAATKPKVRPGVGGTRAPGSPTISEPGERLQARARSSRGRPCTSSAAGRGHMKPLGLKEILGYLSSQERLSEEKLTRGKVKVVMEREVAGGRLRRTRCGNITLPPRGASGRMALTKVGHTAQLDSTCEASKNVKTFTYARALTRLALFKLLK